MPRIAKSHRAASNLAVANAAILVGPAETAFVPPAPLTTFERPASPPLAFLHGESNASFVPPRSLTRMPLLSSGLLKQHHCDIATDTRFRAAARFLQSLWRIDANIAMGIHFSPAGDATPTRIKLGSRLHLKAARTGLNFVAPEVYQLVRRELILREEGAVIDVDRLFANALSSMPLCFNLLGPMALNLDLATTVWHRLLPTFVRTVENISFEHSPGRGDARFLADGSAFDAVMHVITPEGEPATVYIELKYSEAMTGPAAALGPRYDEASRQVRLFQHPASPALRSLALEQLWREHMLAQLAVDLQLTPRAHFVAVGPWLNRRVSTAFRLYAAELVDPTPLDDDNRVGFTPITLEAVIEATAEAGAADLARQLWSRYLDFARVYDHALAADIPKVGFKRPATPSSPAPKQASSEPPINPISEMTLGDPPAVGADGEG
jgi:hypothetical protein